MLPVTPSQIEAPPSGAVVRVQGLGKCFDIYPNDRSRFFEFLGDRTHHAEHWAVRNVSFSVRPGEAFGIVGANGAGKSTLLRLLAGISEPSEGALEIDGRLATLLDLGVGFHSPFSGRDNIELSCALAGMTPAEIRDRIPEIIRFAELGDFIDHPVRTYSTGMQLRLGFSVAVHSDCKVLLIDEVLAVGDQHFQRKCIRRIEQAIEGGAALMLVSHDLHAVRSLCSEALWLERGQPRARGSAREVVDAYIADARVASSRTSGAAPTPADSQGRPPRSPRQAEGGAPTLTLPAEREEVLRRLQEVCAVEQPAVVFTAEATEAPRLADGETLRVSGTGEVRVLRVQLLDDAGREREQFRTGEGMVIAVTIRTTEPVEDPIFGAAIHRDDGVYVYGPNTGFDRVLLGTYHGVYTFYLRYPSMPLLYGDYRVSIAVFDKGHVRPYVWHNQLHGFSIVQDVEDHGLVHLAHEWGVLTWHEP